jgi:hypothetical protein
VNERIIEFRKQCLTEVKDEHGNWINYHFDENKFAELIVQECCQKLENDGMVEVAMEMKQHFGVK